MNLSISINTAAVEASLGSIAKACEDRQGMHSAIASSMDVVTKDHLTSNYLPKDGIRGDFWADVIASRESSFTADYAVETLSELGVHLRYHGGDVFPGKSISSWSGKPTVALAIPSVNVPVAGGRQIRPGRAGVLAFIPARGGGETVGVLVEGEERIALRGKNKGRPYAIPRPGGSLMYTLRTVTHHTPDPNIFPSDAALLKGAEEALRDFVFSFDGL
jgi:hypothetical protein